MANLYFLFIAALSLTPLSPLSPVTNIAPLVAVVAVSLVKEGVEDAKRARKDAQVGGGTGGGGRGRGRRLVAPTRRPRRAQMNARAVGVWRGAAFAAVTWRDVVVGDVVRVRGEGGGVVGGGDRAARLRWSARVGARRAPEEAASAPRRAPAAASAPRGAPRPDPRLSPRPKTSHPHPPLLPTLGSRPGRVPRRHGGFGQRQPRRCAQESEGRGEHARARAAARGPPRPPASSSRVPTPSQASPTWKPPTWTARPT